MEILSVLSDNIIKIDKSFVYLPQNALYSLKISNNNCELVETKIEINGIPQGKWIIEPQSSAYIYRPVNINRHFNVGTVGKNIKIKATIMPILDKNLSAKWITPKVCEKIKTFTNTDTTTYSYGATSVLPVTKQWKNMNSFKMSEPHLPKTKITTIEKTIIPMYKQNQIVNKNFIKDKRLYDDFFVLPVVRDNMSYFR